MKPTQLTPDQQRLLRDQAITPEQPGPVLHDLGVVLDALGTVGVEAAGKYNLLPVRLIGELDERLSRPLHLHRAMKRPLLWSHPSLQGLNLLLRSSGLSRDEGSGDKARLVLVPEMIVEWERLNPTERYFNLLEAWLRHATPEMVGDRGSFSGGLLWQVLRAWGQIPREGLRFNLDQPQYVFVPGFYREFYELALMDLFGLVRVAHPPHPVMPWVPAGVEHVPFGDAALTLLQASLFQTPGSRGDPLAAGDEEDEPAFGAWQPLFRPYFPEWRANLELPEPEAREGILVFRVALGKGVWRRIAMTADATLDDLADWMLRSVNFDSDHLYEFTWRDRLGAAASAFHPYMDEGPSTAEVALGEVPLETGQSIEFRFDFGDNWRFDVRLERVEPPGAKVKAPAILERHGKAPKQYEGGDW